MTKCNKAVLTLIAAWVACGVGIQIVRTSSDYVAAGRVEKAQKEASIGASHIATFTDARRWLVEHGYGVIVWNPHAPDGFVGYSYEDHADGPGPRFQSFVVAGEKMLRPASLLLNPNWVRITFEFRDDGHLTGVVAKKVLAAVPTTRPGG